MKLPRWLVIGMLTSSVLAVLAAAGWWWVTWPERTASEFVELIADEKLETARRILTLDPERPVSSEVQTVSSWKITRLECQSRSLRDVIRRRQTFYAVEAAYEFTVEWKKVIGPDPVFRKRITRDSPLVAQQ